MMKRFLIISAFFTLVITNSAFAYTCQEGHFQIDVPEGWKVENNSSTYNNIQLQSKGHGWIVISWHTKYDSYWAERTGSDSCLDKFGNFNLYSVYNAFKSILLKNGCTIKIDKILSSDDVKQFNIDKGFILSDIRDVVVYKDAGFWALFIKNKYVYELNLQIGTYEPWKKAFDVIIAILNSFCALD